MTKQRVGAKNTRGVVYVFGWIPFLEDLWSEVGNEKKRKNHVKKNRVALNNEKNSLDRDSPCPFIELLCVSSCLNAKQEYCNWIRSYKLHPSPLGILLYALKTMNVRFPTRKEYLDSITFCWSKPYNRCTHVTLHIVQHDHRDYATHQLENRMEMLERDSLVMSTLTTCQGPPLCMGWHLLEDLSLKGWHLSELRGGLLSQHMYGVEPTAIWCHVSVHYTSVKTRCPQQYAENELYMVFTNKNSIL